MQNLEVFEGKSFSDLMKDIYENSLEKKTRINVLTTELTRYIKGAEDAALIVPLIKDYLDIGIKNDELLIKMASVFQKKIASENRINLLDADKGMGSFLTEKEKEEILKDVKLDMKTITEENKTIDSEMNDLLKTANEILNKGN